MNLIEKITEKHPDSPSPNQDTFAVVDHAKDQTRAQHITSPAK